MFWPDPEQESFVWRGTKVAVLGEVVEGEGKKNRALSAGYRCFRLLRDDLSQWSRAGKIVPPATGKAGREECSAADSIPVNQGQQNWKARCSATGVFFSHSTRGYPCKGEPAVLPSARLAGAG